MSHVAQFLDTVGVAYGKNNVEYLDVLPTSSLQFALLPPYMNLVFDEYYAGYIEDIKEVLDLAKQKIFNSFQCSMCAITKPAGVKEVETDGYMITKKNLSELYTIDVPKTLTESDIPFRMSATAGVYVKNHVLLYPRDHICNYLLLMHKPYFRALYSVLWNSLDVFAIFNGNFGSDLYHGHVHLTYKKNYRIVDLIQKELKGKTLTRVNIEYFNIEPVKGIIICASGRDDLYNFILPFVGTYFNYKNENIAVTANLFCSEISGKKYYIMFFMFVRRDIRVLQSDGVMLNAILPACTVNFQPAVDVAPKDSLRRNSFLEKIALKAQEFFSKSYLSYDEIDQLVRWTPVDTYLVKTRDVDGFFNYLYDSTKDTIIEIPPETLQWWIMRMNDKQKKSITENLYGQESLDRSQQYLQTYSNLCVNTLTQSYFEDYCNPSTKVFATFKMLASLYIIVKYIAINKSQLEKTYIADRTILGYIIGAGIYESRRFFKRSANTIFLDGSTTHSVMYPLLTALLKLVENNPEDINYWLDYAFKRIGDPSAFGIVTTSKLRDQTKIINGTTLALKIFPTGGTARAKYEAEVGMVMSKARSYIPNFLVVYGFFNCKSTRTINAKRQYSYDNLCLGNTPTSYILMDMVPNATSLHSQIKNIGWGDTYLQNVLTQIFYSLSVAEYRFDFVHYDLHVGNVLLTKLHDNTKYETYVLQGNKYYIPVTYRTTIIDYGFTHVRDVTPNLDQLDLTALEKRRFAFHQYNPSADIFTLIMSLSVLACVYNPNLLLTKSILFDILFNFFVGSGPFASAFTVNVQNFFIINIGRHENEWTLLGELQNIRANGGDALYLLPSETYAVPPESQVPAFGIFSYIYVNYILPSLPKNIEKIADPPHFIEA